MQRIFCWLKIFCVGMFIGILLIVWVILLLCTWWHPWGVGLEVLIGGWVLWRIFRIGTLALKACRTSSRNGKNYTGNWRISPNTPFQNSKERNSLAKEMPSIAGFPTRYRPPRLGAEYEWTRGSQVKAGFLEDCEVVEVLDQPLHYYLYSAHGKKVTFFPHKGLRHGWVDEP